MLCGVTDFSEVGRSQWVSIVTPLYFGLPTFDFASIISMIIVMLVVMVETTGDSIAVGEIVDKPIGQKELAAVLRADGLSTLSVVFLTASLHSVRSKRWSYRCNTC